jgi:hypothetical protein
MRFCMPHREELKDEIRLRGLWDLVSQSGGEVAARTVSGEGDPLMDAHNMIVYNAARLVSLPYLMTQNPDGTERCPLCAISDCGNPACTNDCASRAKRFIEYAGRDVAELWKDKAPTSSSASES